MKRIAKLLEKIIPKQKVNIFSSKDMLLSSIPYYSLAFVMIFGCQIIWHQPWFLIALIYGIIPLLDQIFTQDDRNPNEQERKELERRDPYFKICLLLTVAVDWFIFVSILKHISSYDFDKEGVYKFLGILFVYANLNATQFSVSHELFHKEMFYKIIGTLHMSKNLYTHYTFEHIYGHHRKVATPQDPASAPQHMNVYRFFWRSFLGTYKSVYNMQKEQKKAIYANYAVLSVLWAFTFTTIVFTLFGWIATVSFIAMATLSVFFWKQSTTLNTTASKENLWKMENMKKLTSNTAGMLLIDLPTICYSNFKDIQIITKIH